MMKSDSGPIFNIAMWGPDELSFKLLFFGIRGMISVGQITRILSLVAFLLLLCGLGVWISQYLFSEVWPLDTQETNMITGLLLLTFAICMMLPFMPAIEFGLVLLAMLDIQGVLILYGITIVALLTSFGVGQLVPVQVLARVFHYLHFHKASELLVEAGSYGEKE